MHKTNNKNEAINAGCQRMVFGIALGYALSSLAVAFDPSTDMATLHDYAYYVQNPQEGRANHSAAEGGVFTSSADRIWLRISLGAATAGKSLLSAGLSRGGQDSLELDIDR